MYMKTPIVHSVIAETVFENIPLQTKKVDRCSSILLIQKGNMHATYLQLIHLNNSQIQRSRVFLPYYNFSPSSLSLAKRISSSSITLLVDWQCHFTVNFETSHIHQHQISEELSSAFRNPSSNRKIIPMLNFIISV